MNFAEYGKLLTEAYDIDKPDAPAEMLSFYRRFIDESGQPALALMCGSGRFLVPLREAGIDVDGVDASPDMLGACRAKLADHNIEATLYEQLLQDLDLPRRYRSAYVGGGGSFGLIPDDKEAAQALERIFDHLELGGRLCLEVQTPKAAESIKPGRVSIRTWVRPDGARIVLQSSGTYDAKRKVIEGIGIYELYVDGKLVATELDEFPQRLWAADEMTDLLEGAGFEDVRISKGYDDAQVDGTEWLLCFKATKPS